jgi:hypothetical protein
MKHSDPAGRTAKEQADRPSHVSGVGRGEETSLAKGDRDVKKTEGKGGGIAGARRSTSINPEDELPIDPESPKLSPA